MGDAVDPGHVLEGGLGGQAPEGADLGHLVFPVPLPHVLDDPVPLPVGEVGIYVGHGDPLRVQEALKEEAEAQGVNVGDAHGVGHQAPGGAPPSRPHGDPVAPGPVDVVLDDEEVPGEAHALNDGKLVKGAVKDGLGGPLPDPLQRGKPLP